ncbi:CDP-diacylglycerol--serine O-phosphatidyltransferase [Porphyromonas sp. COT-108 OH1349]|uniref:CDP-diacylglycerol--serine O-phosphatidyltransferase n=1 Tax=Porphyromonas sp. COT-108 OH1349 TaxID=1537504 RepID=UPI00052C0A15|nr:CDP-diacylglycerol--serine O-phosphatidyltransferase [Porphyromonas sp. COT-108 OH1349]KGN71469.1 hypothetical protein JT26_01435 [Porphyromonas sp. COT-108 OH1349]
MKKHIPNLLTLCNALCGAMAVAMAAAELFHCAVGLIAIAAVLDFLDGFAARMLKAFSPLGKDLDSLADLLSFGIAPAFMLFMVLQPYVGWTALSVMVLVVASVYRLAKFNNDPRQTSTFIGLPTPANAMFWIGMVMFLKNNSQWLTLGYMPYLVIGIAVLFSYLLVSEIPMLSLKKRNVWIYALLVISVALISVFGMLGFSLAIFLYILLSLALCKHIYE